jgi:RNA polymerase sigma-70 factor, ECF subfamily
MRDIRYKDEYDLVHKYLAGDKCAGKNLFAEVYPILERYVFLRTKESILNEADREDIILDALMTSVNKLNTFTGDSKFSTLVIGIAKIKIKEKFRKKKVEVDKIIDIDEIIDNTSHVSIIGRDPLEILIEEEKKQAVDKAIKMLSLEHQQILMMRLFNNMPYKQIAEMSGRSESALDSMFRRAVKAFKENFKNIYF